MNLSLLQTLTWSTVTAAVASALALAAVEPVDLKRSRVDDWDSSSILPADAAVASPFARPAASAAGQTVAQHTVPFAR